MDEHYYMTAIKALAQQIEALEYLNKEYQNEIARLKEQNQNTHIEVSITKGESK